MTPSQSKNDRPIRVLHIIGGLVRGGIETWLMHILRNIDREAIKLDFVVHDVEEGHYEAEVRSLGCQVIRCLQPFRPWIYGPAFRRILRQYGPYDIVHSNVHDYSGYVLRLAKQEGVPARIAHSHIDTSPHRARAGLARRAYATLMARWIQQHATVGLAASKIAAADLFGAAWEKDPRWQVLYYGVDLKPFLAVVDKQALRAELGIPDDAFVVGHVGRFVEQKNHTFLIDIAAEVVKREPKARFLLIGFGALRPSIEEKVARLGLQEHVIFAGTRPDVSQIMVHVMDMFLLPSLFEGLPVVGIEALAAGLPLVISDTITDELDYFPVLVKRLSLSQPASDWAEAVLFSRNIITSIDQYDLLLKMEESPFNIQNSLKQLVQVYRGCITR